MAAFACNSFHFVSFRLVHLLVHSQVDIDDVCVCVCRFVQWKNWVVAGWLAVQRFMYILHEIKSIDTG